MTAPARSAAMRMPMLLRVLFLVAVIGIGSVVVRHITEALQGMPVPREVASGGMPGR